MHDSEFLDIWKLLKAKLLILNSLSEEGSVEEYSARLAHCQRGDPTQPHKVAFILNSPQSGVWEMNNLSDTDGN